MENACKKHCTAFKHFQDDSLLFLSLSRSLSLSHLFVGLWSLVFIIFFIRFHFVATISAFKTKSVATDNAYMLINENETTNKSEFSGVYVCMYRAGSKKPSTTNGKNAVTLTIWHTLYDFILFLCQCHTWGSFLYLPLSLLLAVE